MRVRLRSGNRGRPVCYTDTLPPVRFLTVYGQTPYEVPWKIVVLPSSQGARRVPIAGSYAASFIGSAFEGFTRVINEANQASSACICSYSTNVESVTRPKMCLPVFPCFATKTMGLTFVCCAH